MVDLKLLLALGSSARVARESTGIET